MRGDGDGVVIAVNVLISFAININLSLYNLETSIILVIATFYKKKYITDKVKHEHELA